MIGSLVFLEKPESFKTAVITNRLFEHFTLPVFIDVEKFILPYQITIYYFNLY